MSELARLFINPYGLAYLVVLVGIQLLYRQWRKRSRSRITTRRLTRGLPPGTLLGRSGNRQHCQQQVGIEIALWAISTIVVPIAFIELARILEGESQGIISAQNGLFVIAITLLSLTAIGGLGAMRAMVSGFVFEAITAFTTPFQPGDHLSVTSANTPPSNPPTRGKVIRLNAFFVTLENSAGQRINIPTHTLWQSTITVLNGSASQLASELASECKVVFYLSHTATHQQLRLAESILLEAIHNSAYLEPSSPADIHYAQSYHAIKLTAIAYVAAIDNAAAFSSDITRQFLDLARQKQLPLAHAPQSSNYPNH
ncbi:MAG: mechanosensitive ion channel domain-containing protein [Cyanobacteria bacterium J06581_3]